MKKIVISFLLVISSLLAFSQSNNFNYYKMTQYTADAGVANTYTATITGLPIVVNQTIKVKFEDANSGASTLSINGGAAISIYKNGVVLTTGDISADQVVLLSYNGAEWDMIGGGGGGLTIGATAIASGTDTRVLYDNSGTLGEYTISGTGSVAMTNSPAFTTPDLGTPSAATLTNATGLPISSGVSGLGTGVSTWLGTPSWTNFNSMITGTAPYWSLATSSTQTFTSPLRFDGTSTNYLKLNTPVVIGTTALTTSTNRLEVWGTGTGTDKIMTLKNSAGTERMSVLSTGVTSIIGSGNNTFGDILLLKNSDLSNAFSFSSNSPGPTWVFGGGNGYSFDTQTNHTFNGGHILYGGSGLVNITNPNDFYFGISRDVASSTQDNFSYVRIGGTETIGANSLTTRGLRLSRTYAIGTATGFTINGISSSFTTTGSATPTMIRGFYYNPTIAVAPTTELAFHAERGSILVGASSLGASSPILQVRGIGTTTGNIALFENSAGTSRLSLNDQGDLSHTGKYVLTGTSLSGSSTSDNFVNISGTMPTTMTATTIGMDITFTGAGSSNQNNGAVRMQYNAGYTGAGPTFGANWSNLSAGTNTTAPTMLAHFGNRGVHAFSYPTTTGHNYGLIGQTANGDLNVGVLGHSQTSKNAATNIGMAGLALNTGTSPKQIGGYFALVASATALPTAISGALIADNGSTTSDILRLRDNGTDVFSVVDGGRVIIANSVTPSSASDTGVQGTIAWDTNYIYICVATNTWKRVAIATW